jgi:hypothetical protein
VPGQDFNVKQGRCEKQTKTRPCSNHVYMYRAASRKSPKIVEKKKIP